MAISQLLLATGGAAQSFIVASGGTVTTDGNFNIHTFTTSINWIVTEAPPGATIRVFICGGGGGGGSVRGGGGGGAEYKEELTYTFGASGIVAGTYTVTIGLGSAPPWTGVPTQGGSSSITHPVSGSLSAAGGGSAASAFTTPSTISSGNGGGGSFYSGSVTAGGQSFNGNRGGNAYYYSSSAGVAGAGGGADSNGLDGTYQGNTSSFYTGLRGASGYGTDISGSTIYYCGGGSSYGSNGTTLPPLNGGGGYSNTSPRIASGAGGAGTYQTQNHTSGYGAKGSVIIRYQYQ